MRCPLGAYSSRIAGFLHGRDQRSGGKIRRMPLELTNAELVRC
jgi:hypothetical protein